MPCHGSFLSFIVCVWIIYHEHNRDINMLQVIRLEEEKTINAYYDMTPTTNTHSI